MFDSEAWSRIAQLGLDDLKESLMRGYRNGAPFEPDPFPLIDTQEKTQSILDFGCGIGRNFPVLTPMCSQLSGYDVPAMISACRSYAAVNGVTLSANWPEIRARHFDLVVASFVFQHLDLPALRFYLDEIAHCADLLYVRTRSWSDAYGHPSIVAEIQYCEKFDVIAGTASWKEALTAGDDRNQHYDFLLRSTCTSNHRVRNRRLFQHDSHYDELTVEDVRLRFYCKALKDQRGIGRVSRELLEYLRARAQKGKDQTQTSNPKRRPVHLFPSIHWCPDQLPDGSVVLIHDVIPLLYPELFPEAARIWRGKYRSIAQQAELIVTVSESGGDDIVSRLGIAPRRVHVIANGVTRLPVAQAGTIPLPTRRYIVYVGSDDPHKNIGVLIESLKYRQAREFDLVLVGEIQSSAEDARKQGVSERVHHMGRLPDAQLGLVISKAVALALPSLYEGFGLPPFEAALLGVPSVCSTRPAMNELLRDAALFAPPDRAADWAAAFGALLNPSMRQTLADAAKLRAQQYSIGASAEKLLGVIKNLDRSLNGL